MGAIEEHGQNDVDWRDFLRGHGGDIEDAMLSAAAAFELENPPKAELVRPTWGEVQKAGLKDTVFDFVIPLPESTEMRFVKLTTESGVDLSGFVPLAFPEEDGIAVRYGDGKRGILFLHPSDDSVQLEEIEQGEAEVSEADAEEQVRLIEMSKIEVKIVGYNPMNERQLYGLSISDEFALSIMEAWEHVDHEGSPCKETAESYLTRFVHQVVGALHVGNAKKDGL